jgi:hypothetical protein
VRSCFSCSLAAVAALLGVCLTGLSTAQPLAAAELEGKYLVEGRDPKGASRYSGQVVVVKESDTYSVVWKIQNQVLYGTGVLQDKVFAVTYLNYGGPRSAPGLAVYETNPEGTLTGRFTVLGAKEVGIEAWIPMGSSN